MYTVLVISCHPDDMEIACAGTLLKCKARGDRVVIRVAGKDKNSVHKKTSQKVYFLSLL